MRKTVILIFSLVVITWLSIVGCKLLNRLDGHGQYVCDTHGHVVDEKDYPKKVIEFNQANGCLSWTYRNKDEDETKK